MPAKRLITATTFGLLLLCTAPRAEFPFGGDSGGNPQDWPAYLFVISGDCSSGNGSANDLPANFDCTNFEYTDYFDDGTDGESALRINPQEFYGVRGPGVNRAWEVTTGRPDVAIAVLDSGIRWEDNRPDLIRKYYLNAGELPYPEGGPNPADARFAGYDINDDGVFNVVDYWADSRAADLNGNGVVDPEDLIRIFSDGIDDDQNGYADDISGWDFYENDNNPQDDTDYGHGTGEAEDSTGEAGFSNGICPNCMVMPLRVGDSFVADTNHYAEATVYAADNGVAVLQVALGTLNHTSFGRNATNYAHEQGVFLTTSAADEAAGHHNWPAAYEHANVMNSIRPPSLDSTVPHSYLLFNGCTNYGGYTMSSVPSTSCSSEATGKGAGMAGLLVSAARNAVERGAMTNAINDDGSFADWALSHAEMRQLWRLACDDIDFSTPYPEHSFSPYFADFRPPWWFWNPLVTPNNYALSGTVLATDRYHTVRGWDYFTGYGRINAARLVRFVGLENVNGLADREYLKSDGPFGVGPDALLSAQDRIPPEAELQTPLRWRQYAYDSAGQLLIPDDDTDPTSIVVSGRVAANRVTSAGGTFDYVLEFAPHVQGAHYPEALGLGAADSEEKSAGPWFEVTRQVGLTAAFDGELGRIPVRLVAHALASTPNPLDADDDPTAPQAPERFAVRLRLRVLAHPTKGADTVNNEAVHQEQIDVYPAAESILRNDLGVDGAVCGLEGSPTFQDLDGDGAEELLMASSDGLLHAFTDLAAGRELPGWPVFALPYPSLPSSGFNAFTLGLVSDQVYGSFLLGSPAVADLDDDGSQEVVAVDMEGNVYAWQSDGSLRSGFPTTVDFGLTREVPCGPATIPDCDDYENAPPKRDRWNSRDWSMHSAPAIGDLDPTTPGLEIVAGCSDGHVYAWHADGSSVNGWPVILRDPDKVAAMDPTTRFVTYTADAEPAIGTKIIPTPSLGDIDGDGDLEVVVGVNEEYTEVLNFSIANDPVLLLLSLIEEGGNTRLYALHHTGAATPGTPATDATPHTQDQAYCAGWPVPLGLAVLDLLPTIGAGINTQAALADLDDDGTLEIACASVVSPLYILRHDGSSFFGVDDDGTYLTADSALGDYGPASCADNGSTLIALGGVTFGSIDGGASVSVAGASGSLIRILDLLLEGRQTSSEDHLVLWDSLDGSMEPASPTVINDLQFFAHPIFADITGDGRAEVIQGTAVSDLVATGQVNDCASTTRYFTGGWMTGSAAVGHGGLHALAGPRQYLVASTREGYLRAFPTETPTPGTVYGQRHVDEWPEYGHDPRNSGNLQADGEPPVPPAMLSATALPGGKVLLQFRACGDDGLLGRAASYDLRSIPGHFPAPQAWSSGTPLAHGGAQFPAAGERERLSAGPLPAGPHTLLLRARDEAGNGSAVAEVQVSMP